ncbi:Cytoplasmic dynein 1 light intermediate chain 2 [Erysiphe neolycopersici]|uniref:Cytoplasmic dynein 1 light intermediate chain 2 n=1 Tax=Erysiphe neolycopersici TaxID=212602 RepID=A0A420HWV2_9PEZI|nr:Cytoplasmic dynein 1 light intermediate chain 2 [Erysiphe neolycopersici]
MAFLNKTVSMSSERDTLKDVESKKDMWSSMLNSVSSGKSLPEKNIIMLGGNPESQREFLENLSADESKSLPSFQNNKKPPTANNLALGYTYHDVLDADHEVITDTLARLSVFLLSDSSPSFAPLLKPLLTPRTIPNTLVVILLDWSQPWLWLRQLRDWIQLLRTLLISLDENCKEKMEEVMISWRDKGRGLKSIDGLNAGIVMENDLNLPLGHGEWDMALGVPLCVVCQNSERIEFLEKERGWKEEDFDFVLQCLRTILLKHGASLIYVAPSTTNNLQSLIHSSLGIHSLLKRQPLRHNVIDRDKVLVPPNWDSWGKIRVLREGFDAEAVSIGWSCDIEKDPITKSNEIVTDDAEDLGKPIGAVDIYERVIQDPSRNALQSTALDSNSDKLEVISQDTQEFLARQFEILESNKPETGHTEMDSNHYSRGRKLPTTSADGLDLRKNETHISEHIGPVQFNMGGIQVDADDILQKLKDRQNYKNLEPTTSSALTIPSQNDALASFFEGLMHRSGGAGTSNASRTKST